MKEVIADPAVGQAPTTFGRIDHLAAPKLLALPAEHQCLVHEPLWDITRSPRLPSLGARDRALEVATDPYMVDTDIHKAYQTLALTKRGNWSLRLPVAGILMAKESSRGPFPIFPDAKVEESCRVFPDDLRAVKACGKETRV